MSSPNLDLWSRVEKTDPTVTKKVSYGREGAKKREFTAVDAYSQIRRATQEWGRIGDTWGYEVPWHTIEDGYFWVELYLWYPLEPVGKSTSGITRGKVGPVFGAARLDGDAGKKAVTDALTKALSYLGFNADVFLGKFDDNKYVAETRREFANGAPDQTPPPESTGSYIAPPPPPDKKGNGQEKPEPARFADAWKYIHDGVMKDDNAYPTPRSKFERLKELYDEVTKRFSEPKNRERLHKEITKLCAQLEAEPAPV